MKYLAEAICRAILLTALTGVSAAQAVTLQRSSRQACTICHLGWVETFALPEPNALIDRPEKLLAAESETCLGCHDGSVVDSRRRVWLEHGHQTGIKPPATMNIPKQLPLTNGKLACRTCHTAHSATGSEDLASAVFLRVPNETSQLCKMCHVDKIGGPRIGVHPIGGMPWPIPQKLIEAGAKARPGDRQVHCQVCHTPHGSKREHLLVMGVTGNELCLTCHKQLRPRMWRPRKAVHPDRPVVSSQEQIAAIEHMDTRLGSENRLICLSCHKMHAGVGGRFMLADVLEGSNFCIRCHSEKRPMLDTAHDLRVSAPDTRNLLGMTPSVSGPCGSCHMFHNLAIRPNQTEADPAGVCTSCHTPGGPAKKTSEMKLTHPINVPVPTMAAESTLPLFAGSGPSKDTRIMTCLTCHDPHNSSQPGFLRANPDNLCRTCHPSQAGRIADGPHFTKIVQLKLPGGVDKDRRCLVCHKIHTWSPAETLWTVAPVEGHPTSDAVCLNCHKDISWSTAEHAPVKAVMHPREVIDPEKVNLPLVVSPTGTKPNRIGCQTCHDPHAGKGSHTLLRSAERASPQTLCFECHSQVAPIQRSMHSPEVMAKEKRGRTDKLVCGPCHAVHAVKGSTRTMLWAAGESSEGATPFEQRCLACHGPGGRAKRPTAIVRHPPEPLAAIGWKDVDVDKVDKAGGDQITCFTCHLAHGRAAAKPAEHIISIAELSATKPMLRPNVAETRCAICHNFDAITRLLYYHRPEKRR